MMRLRLPRRRIWRVAIYIGALLLVLIAIDLMLVQSRRTIHPAYDTTRIVEPLQADGSIDYLSAIEEYFSRGVTRENNAAPMVLQALGRKALAWDQPPDGITNRLGMPHLPETGDYFVLYADYCKQHSLPQEEGEADLLEPLSWPLKIDEATTRWIEANEKPLALIAEATKQPRFFIPFNGGYRPETLPQLLLPYLNPLREVARALRQRGLQRLERGDVAGFRADMWTMHLLARLIGQPATMIDRLVAIRIETMACEAERFGAASGKLSAEQARAMLDDLSAMGNLPSMSESVDISERYMVLDTLQVMARAGPVRTGELINMLLGMRGPPSVFRFIPLRFEELARSVNEYNDGALVAMRKPTYPQRAAALSQWEQYVKPRNVEQLSALDLLSKTWVAQLFAPSLLRAQTSEDTARMQGRLTQVALALAACKAERGAYPATLAELSPNYLKIVPNDVFSEKPLTYSRDANGYTLYSVGPNMIDDGGKSEGKADDIIGSAP